LIERREVAGDLAVVTDFRVASVIGGRDINGRFVNIETNEQVCS